MKHEMNTKQTRRLLRMIVPAYSTFNVYSHLAEIMTSLGPLYVATSADQNTDWDVEVIDENNCRELGPKDAQGRPDHSLLQVMRPADVVGLYGGLTSTIPRVYEVAKWYKSQGITTLVGGQHFVGDNIQEALDNGADYVVVGEGEETIIELLNALASKGDVSAIHGIAFRKDGKTVQTPERPPIHDLEALPLPDFSLVRYAKVSLFPINWTRGCQMHCEFCTVKSKPRSISPERMFKQITALVEEHGASEFFIVDDLFGQDRKAALRLCDLLARYRKSVNRKVSISVQIRLDKARDTELLLAMREAGVAIVVIGFESPIPEELEAMNKKLKPQDMVELSRLYHKQGFLMHGMFIFGYPMAEGASFTMPAEKRVKIFRKFVRDSKIDTVQILLPVPLPGTEMTQRLKDQNRIFPLDVVGWEYYDGNFPLFSPDPPLTPENLQAAQRKINGRFYQFQYMFEIGIRVLLFPTIIFELHNLKRAWRRWYRNWRNSLIRFGGWMTIQRWNKEFNKGIFTDKLNQAKQDQADSQK